MSTRRQADRAACEPGGRPGQCGILEAKRRNGSLLVPCWRRGWAHGRRSVREGFRRYPHTPRLSHPTLSASLRILHSILRSHMHPDSVPEVSGVSLGVEKARVQRGPPACSQSPASEQQRESRQHPRPGDTVARSPAFWADVASGLPGMGLPHLGKSSAASPLPGRDSNNIASVHWRAFLHVPSSQLNT